MVAFTQGDTEIASGGLFRLCFLAAFESDEKGGIRIAPEMMTQDPERIERIAEETSGLSAGEALDEIGAQGLINTLAGRERFQEEALALA